MPDELDFETVREEFPERWERADPTTALIERLNAHGWRVTLPGGEDVHHVALALDDGQHVGWCRSEDDMEPCPGQKYHDGPCSHLCTLRKADVVNYRDNTGQPVTIEELGNDPEQERADQVDRAPPMEAHTGPARADGGFPR